MSGYFWHVLLLFLKVPLKGIQLVKLGEYFHFLLFISKAQQMGRLLTVRESTYLRFRKAHTQLLPNMWATSLKKNKLQSEQIRLSSWILKLKEQVLQLKEITITANYEDPAYQMIREAIKKRKFHEKKIHAFKMDAYLKGLARLNKKPDKILGKKVVLDTGILYLSESVSKFSFESPNKISEKMISSKVSGNEQGFSFNQAADFNINAYKKLIDLGMERGYVSPIAPNAFQFYEYEFLGILEENGKLVNKIKVIPKRATDPVFEGVIYLLEDDWSFYAIDLLVTKARGLSFVDSLQINQVFTLTQHDIWMPLSQKLTFTFGIFGFRGSGYYIGIFTNYEIEPNYDVYRDLGTYKSNFGKTSETELFQKGDFTAEVLLVEQGANERDTAYWKAIRPIPLTEIENEDYRVKDSIRLVKESSDYKDSVDAETNKLTLGNIFLSGYMHSNSLKSTYWNLPPIMGIFQYNTVEGLVLEVKPTISKLIRRLTKYWIRPSFRYGNSSKKLYSKIEGSYQRLDTKSTSYLVGGGRYVEQFNEGEAIFPFINSILTLAGGKNYMKIYRKTFAYFGFQQELKNGILFRGKVEYAQRDTLTNMSSFTWAPESKTDFTSNQPKNMELDNTGFGRNRALIFEIDFRFRFKQVYMTYPDRRTIWPSKYPEIFLTYRKGIKALGSNVDFDFIKVHIQGEVKLGLVGTSNYLIGGGAFLNDASITLIDFNHFSGSKVVLSPQSRRIRFQLLPFYLFSTSKPYLEAHYQHHFNEFIFNKIPLIKKLNLQAVASANYLTNETIGHYVELGAGIEHIFNFFQIIYFRSYQNKQFFGSGIRVGLGF